MSEACKAVLGKNLNFKRDFHDYTGATQFKDIDQNYYNTLANNLPKIEKTERYIRTYNKFELWLDRNSQATKPYRMVGGWKGQKVEWS
jgi:hypothetical protein